MIKPILKETAKKELDWNLILQDSRLIDTMLEWAVSDNIWLRRVAIDYQQEYKDITNVDILERIIVSNLGSDEFFIEKYGAKMNSLSVKEASKYL